MYAVTRIGAVHLAKLIFGVIKMATAAGAHVAVKQRKNPGISSTLVKFDPGEPGAPTPGANTNRGAHD